MYVIIAILLVLVHKEAQESANLNANNNHTASYNTINENTKQEKVNPTLINLWVYKIQ